MDVGQGLDRSVISGGGHTAVKKRKSARDLVRVDDSDEDGYVSESEDEYVPIDDRAIIRKDRMGQTKAKGKAKPAVDTAIEDALGSTGKKTLKHKKSRTEWLRERKLLQEMLYEEVWDMSLSILDWLRLPRTEVLGVKAM
jgi:hypothetical protein